MTEINHANTAAIRHRSADTDCYAIDENWIEIRLHTGREIDRVEIIHGDPFMGGASQLDHWEGVSQEMIERFTFPQEITWSGKLCPKYKREQYYFRIHFREECYYLTEDRLYSEEEFLTTTRRKNFYKFPWLNDGDIPRVPEWARDTIWYQIMPDRFAIGSNGARDYDWTGEHQRMPWDNAHPHWSDFYGGNLRGIIEHLDYLEDLGVNGLYLTPIWKSSSNHKYNTYDYYEVDPDFGSKEDLMELIRLAHDKGMRIMLLIEFHRVSVCMGDDVWNGKYTIEMPDDATLGELLYIILHGGNGNIWPIPYTGANSNWWVQSNIGNLAKIYTDNDGEWHIEDYYCDAQTPLKDLGIKWTFGSQHEKTKR